jgi:hypothetical protein
VGSDYRFSCGTAPLRYLEAPGTDGYLAQLPGRDRRTSRWDVFPRRGCCRGPVPAAEQGTLWRGQLPFFLWGGARAQFRQALDAQLPGLCWGAGWVASFRDVYPWKRPRPLGERLGGSGPPRLLPSSAHLLHRPRWASYSCPRCRVSAGCCLGAWVWAGGSCGIYGPHISFTDRAGSATLVHDAGRVSFTVGRLLLSMTLDGHRGTWGMGPIPDGGHDRAHPVSSPSTNRSRSSACLRLPAWLRSRRTGLASAQFIVEAVS